MGVAETFCGEAAGIDAHGDEPDPDRVGALPAEVEIVRRSAGVIGVTWRV